MIQRLQLDPIELIIGVTCIEHVSQALELPSAPDSLMPIRLNAGSMIREHVLGFQDFSSAPDDLTLRWTKASD